MSPVAATLFSRRGLVAWTVLAACGVLTVLAWMGLQEERRRSAEVQFELHAGEVVSAIEKRLRKHEQILLGGAGLFDVRGSVQRAEWRTYVERLRLKENFPGIQGMGYTTVIQPAELAGHVAAVRAEGFPDYSVRPDGARALYTAIVYLEPFSGRNLAAFGYDMFSEATRQHAMRQAAEQGRTVISGKVRLVQETHGKEQAGFLMYVPVYRKGGAFETPAARWRALRGFVYSPYRVDDLMQGILGNSGLLIDFSLHDGASPTEAGFMYDSAVERADAGVGVPAHVTTRRIEAYGHVWTLTLRSRPAFDRQFVLPHDLLVPTLGGGISFALFALTLSLLSRREQALALANEMSARRAESEERFRHILETSPAAARIARAGGHQVIFANRRYAQLINAADDAVMGIDPQAYYVNPADYLDILKTLQAGGKIFDRLVELAIPGAGRKWVLASYLPIPYDGTLAVLGWFYDITDLKRAEAAREEQARHTQAILDNMVDGVITIDRRGLIRSFNPAAERIFGYRAQDVMGQNVNMLMPSPHREQHDRYLQNYQATGVARVIGIGREVEGRRRDGSLFPMELAVSEIEQSGQPMYVGMVRDITERKRVERMKSEFVSTVSHELRTPLTSISGALGLIAGGALGEMSEQARQMLAIAQRNSQRLTHLINDLLDMEKIAAGKMQFDIQLQPLRPLVEQALEAHRGYGAERAVELALAGAVPEVQVRVDSQRLLQVLSNLLSNAIKFSPENGTVEVDVEAGAGQVRVRVRDHGAGVPAGFRDRIFQKFAQADASDTRQKGGTGLGLAISRELIERMQGRIGFESTEGEGATFYFELPVSNATESPAPAKPVPTGTARILVVEDDPDVAHLLSIMLGRAGYATDIAGTGQAALDALAGARYDAVTLDLMLPDIAGLEIIRRLRSQAETAALPILVISAKMEEGRLAVHDTLAAVEWLAKPVDERQMRGLLGQLLGDASVPPARILHVEDDADLHAVVRAMVGDCFALELATTLDEARARVGLERFDVVMLDLQLPDGSGWDLLPDIRARQPHARVVVLTGADLSSDQTTRVEAALSKTRVSPEGLLEALGKRVPI